MNILETILNRKKKEVEERKSLYPVKLLERSIYYQAEPVSLVTYLRRKDKAGIIAEYKRQSPSKGIINRHAPVERTSIGYMQAGASALSVLTDTDFFGGKNEDLTIARKFNYCPILRKDFMIDEYQIIEARSIGADVILLLANALSPKRVRQMARTAKGLGMEVLLEVRDKEELNAISPEIDAVGVNNRDLKTFRTDIKRSFDLIRHLPKEVIRISESGIDAPETILKLKKAGFDGFLIGETFMRNSRPEDACASLIRELNK